MALMICMEVKSETKPTASVQIPQIPVPKTSTFFRDHLSETYPQKGALTVCAMLRKVSIKPIILKDIPHRLWMTGESTPIA